MAPAEHLPKYSHAEVERRWLVTLEDASKFVGERERTIEDRYIHGTRLRLRLVQEQGLEPIYKLGKKYGRGECSEAVVSIYLSQSEYVLLAALPARTLTKKRLSVAGGSLDVHVEPAHSFAVFEVEFPSAETAASYVAPDFVGTEVTAQARYSGFALAAGEA